MPAARSPLARREVTMQSSNGRVRWQISNMGWWSRHKLSNMILDSKYASRSTYSTWKRVRKASLLAWFQVEYATLKNRSIFLTCPLQSNITLAWMKLWKKSAPLYLAQNAPRNRLVGSRNESIGGVLSKIVLKDKCVPALPCGQRWDTLRSKELRAKKITLG